MIEQVTIVGMGALGILYGDRLSRYLGADHVRFLAAGERLERYRREGAWCNGKKCAFQFSDGTDGEAQLLIFAVKAPALEEAIALAAPCVGEETVVLSVLNGVNIKKYDYNEYTSIFSVVFQDFRLFSFSLGQNVSASASYDEDKVIECLKKAGFAERINSLPNKLNTFLYKDIDADGVEISGGEAQKLALARALYKNAPFIILDEPTAALDPISEYEVYSKFNEIAGTKTAIYISHRLASCRFCDKIAVFHEGEIIQLGSHEELLADSNGKYYELWNAQAQYYTT